MFCEIVYEDGTVSVAEYKDDAEAKSAVMEQHDRAKTARTNGPQELPASRIAKVFVYDKHPGDFNADGTLSSDEVQAAIKDLVKGVDVVDVMALSQAVSNLAHPMQEPTGPFGSRFKAKETGELELSL